MIVYEVQKKRIFRFVKHYKDSPLLIIFNVITEYCLMLATYLLCGFLRCHILLSFGKAFYYKDIFRFASFAIGIYLFAILLYGLKGDYSTIHFGYMKKEIRWVSFVQVFCGLMGASFLFFFHGTQFSRLYLIMIIVANSLVVSLKRIFFSKLGELVYAKLFIA